MFSTDLSGIFSRFFVLGFLVPAAGTVGFLSLALSDAFQPSAYADASGSTRVLAGGVLAVFIGLVLLGLRRSVMRLYEGYPFIDFSLLKPIGSLLIRRQRRRFDRLTQDAERKAKARILLSRNYGSGRPANNYALARERLLPTRFGNRLRAAEDYAWSRWGLGGVIVSRLIDALRSDRECELQVEAKSDIHFFLNSSLGSALCGILFLIDTAAGNHSPFFLVAALGAVLTGCMFYFCAVGAAGTLGDEIRTSIDLHHLDVYDVLGMRRPEPTEDDEVFGKAASRFLAVGEPIPPHLRALPQPKSIPTGGGTGDHTIAHRVGIVVGRVIERARGGKPEG
jgi:hypothetical protein